MKFIELTQENFDKYAQQIVNLCDLAVELNEKNEQQACIHEANKKRGL